MTGERSQQDGRLSLTCSNCKGRSTWSPGAEAPKGWRLVKVVDGHPLSAGPRTRTTSLTFCPSCQLGAMVLVDRLRAWGGLS